MTLTPKGEKMLLPQNRQRQFSIQNYSSILLNMFRRISECGLKRLCNLTYRNIHFQIVKQAFGLMSYCFVGVHYDEPKQAMTIWFPANELFSLT